MRLLYSDPNITGATRFHTGYDVTTTDAIFVTNYSSTNFYGTRTESSFIMRAATLNIDASRSNSIYDNSATVQPRANQVLMIIKA